jgi:translocation and assembly module TamB
LRRFPLILGVALLLPGGVLAQEEEGGTFLERFLERNLSGAGRDVRVTGFEGLLSSTARMQRLTIADDEGVWLTLEGVTLDWSRAALLRGRLSVNTLTADEIVLARPPQGEADPALPNPEASGFRLPDLPVAVRIGEISSPSITLGEPVFGIESAFSLEGALTLEGGEGSGMIDVRRLDGPQGTFLIDAAFSNETRVLDIDVSLQEAPGGIVATLAGFPGEPSVDLDISGQGPLSDFSATLALATGGEPRLEGTLVIGGENVAAGEPVPFRAAVSGDVAPLFAPDYRDFFGNDVSLDVAGRRGADGSLDLDTFALEARSISLDGRLALGAGGLPQSFDLDGRIASQDGAPVLLPIPGEPTRVDAVKLRAAFDAGAGNTWDGTFRISGLDRPGFSAAEIALDGGGTIAGNRGGAGGGFTVGLDFAAEALDLGDPAAGEALGERVTGRIEIAGVPDEPLRIGRFDLTGESYALESAGTLDIADRDLAIDGRARVSASDLSVFSGVAQRPLAGSAELTLSGRGALLAGTFDADVEGRTTGLAIGIPQVDNLVTGTTNLTLSAARDLEGITLRTFRLGSPVARITAEGVVRSVGSRLNLSASLDDGALVLPGLDGRHSLSLIAEGDGEVWAVRSSLSGATLSGSVVGEIDDSGASPAFEGTATLDAASLAPFAVPSGFPELRGALSLRLDGSVVADLSRFDLRASMEEEGLSLGRADLDRLLTGGLSVTLDAAREPEGPVTLRALSLAAPGLSAEAQGTLTGLPPTLGEIDADALLSAAFDGRLSVRARDLAPLGPLAGLPELSGSLDATAAGSLAADLSRFDLRLDATERGLTLGRPDLDALLSGGLALALETSREPGGPVLIDTLTARTPTISVAAEGALSGLPEALVPLPPDLAETAVFEGRVVLDADNLAPAGPLAGLRGLGGALRATMEGSVALDLETLDLRLDANGANFRTGVEAADAYLGGGTVLAIDVARSDGMFQIRRARFASPGLTASAEGQLGRGDGALAAEVRIDNLGRIVEGFSGPATARVQANATGSGPWTVAANIDGPGGTTLRTEGSIAPSLDRVDLSVRGDVPLGLANTFIQPRSVSGRAALDLKVSGPPALSSVSGRIATSDARFVAPTIGIVLERVTAEIALASGRAQVDLGAAVQGGGRITVAGPVALSAPYAGDLRIAFDNARLRDPALYETTVNGNLTLSGPLAGGAGIAGRLALGRTELRIPSGVTGGTAPIPDITHIAEPPPVRQTRVRAGLIDESGNRPGSEQDARRGPGYSLDIRIDALNQIFIRGRGLDAELGGSLRIGGTTNNVIPAGQFDLLRGRLDILGRRLVLDQGSITLQGDFDPFLFLSASSSADGITARVVLSGRHQRPDIRFESSPELPEDEIVSRLLFGRGIENISAFQAAQLASSVATLTGSGGEGLLGNLRKGFGLDDLDVTTNDAGQAQLTLGTYIADNLYTDVSVSDGRTELEINLELTPSITVTGSTADNGDSSIGIRFERDF